MRLARSANDWTQAAAYLARINLDTATSKNLECAAQICRDHGFLAKAADLYHEAAARDPVRIVEKLAEKRATFTELDIERLGVSGHMVLELLAELPEDQRIAVRGRIVDERGYEDLAASLSCSPSVAATPMEMVTVRSSLPPSTRKGEPATCSRMRSAIRSPAASGVSGMMTTNSSPP